VKDVLSFDGLAYLSTSLGTPHHPEKVFLLLSVRVWLGRFEIACPDSADSLRQTLLGFILAVKKVIISEV
jgi:hypothetical protein